MALENNSNAETYVAEKTGYTTRSSAFRIVEAYKTIRVNLLYTLANAKSRAIVVSSAEPAAGKSTTCSNLAIVMAQTGAKVVLIDADMRKPVQHRNFHLSKTMGLSKILGGLNSLDECIKQGVLPNLDVIPAGSIPPNPSELLGSERMNKLLVELQKRYDYVFLDTPPIGVVSDALVLAPQTAGVVLVARQRETTYEELKESIEGIEQVQATMLGVVINDVRMNKTGYGSYDKKRYYRSYNYEYGEKSEND